MTLAEALERTCELLETSVDSDWSAESAAQIRGRLLVILAKVRAGEPYDRGELVLQFLPTGFVQETALDNGWSDEYLALAQVVDRATSERRAWWRFWRLRRG